MTHTLLIARREIVDRRNVFIAAAILSLVPFLFHLFPNATRVPFREATTVTALIVACIFGLAMAVATGATMIGRDLSERRLGFYLSRPLSASAIWFGKLFGSFTVVALGFAIVMLPSLLVNGFVWPKAWRSDDSVPLMIGALFAVVLITHALSSFIRSRSAWIAFDAAALTLLSWGWWASVSRLLRVWGGDVVIAIGIVTVVTAVFALLVGGVVQLRVGRSDVRRSHQALSLFIWASLAVLVLAIGAYTFWFFTADVDDIVYVGEAAVVPNSNWMLVGGAVKGRGRSYSPMFLRNETTGTTVPIRDISVYSSPMISADGSTVVVVSHTDIKKDRTRERQALVTAIKLKGDDPTIHRFQMPEGGGTLSHDGRYLVSRGYATVQVYSVPDGRLVGSVGVTSIGRPVFVDNDVLRLYHESDGRVMITDFDLRRRSTRRVGMIEGPVQFLWPDSEGDGSRVIVRRRTSRPDVGGKVTVHDGMTGAELFSLGEHSGRARFLPDGRIVAMQEQPPALNVLSRDGQLLGSAPLPYEHGGPAALSSDGRIYAAVRPSGTSWMVGETLLINPATMKIDRRYDGFFTNSTTYSATLRPSGDLFIDRNRSLWKIDPASGEKRLLIQGRWSEKVEED
jgi:MFS family permease